MKSKLTYTLFGFFLVTIFALAPTVFGQSSQATTPGSTGAGVSLGNMGISSVGNMPVMSMIKGTTSDGSTQVIISYSPAPPVSGQPLSIVLTFTDANGNLIHHQNYAISVTQNGNEVFSNIAGHTHTGNDIQTTNNLASSNPVDIKITLNGVGLPGTDPSTWTGPKGDVLNFHVVPEFGPVTGLIIAISIIGVIVISRSTFHL